jgi:UDP-MurNAc hydroxylase
LLRHNDVDNSADNAFPMMDTAVKFLEDRGHAAFLAMPGDVLDVGCDRLKLVSRSMSVTEVYGHRREYIQAYADRKHELIKENVGKLEHQPGTGRLFKEEWLRILSSSRTFVRQINAAIRFELEGDAQGDVLIDCRTAGQFSVRDYQGEDVDYRFTVDHRFVADLLRHRYVNFENVFLSMRLHAWREPDVFNDALFAILVNFDHRRLQLAEEAFERRCHEESDRFEILHQGVRYLIQRRCPHMMADLSVTGEVCEGIITCTRHAWQFRLSDGECLNVTGPRLEVTAMTPGDVHSDSA